MLAMSESVDRRYFKAVFFNTIDMEADVALLPPET
jgi:hypothetical protein